MTMASPEPRLLNSEFKEPVLISLCFSHFCSCFGLHGSKVSVVFQCCTVHNSSWPKLGLKSINYLLCHQKSNVGAGGLET